MSLLVGITGGAGFVASFLLLKAGLTEMWLRYLAAFAVAYIVFLGLLWLWMRSRTKDYVDALDLIPTPQSQSDGLAIKGKGGEFGGDGASGSFDVPVDSTTIESSDTLDPVGDAVRSAVDADEFTIPIVALAVLAALVLSSFWVIYSAPVLFAELLIDGVLAASLYRRLRELETRHWLQTAIRRTFMPFLVAASIAVLVGWGMSRYAPEAKSIGDVLLHVRGK
jgi:hypothetical protein